MFRFRIIWFNGIRQHFSSCRISRNSIIMGPVTSCANTPGHCEHNRRSMFRSALLTVLFLVTVAVASSGSRREIREQRLAHQNSGKGSKRRDSTRRASVTLCMQKVNHAPGSCYPTDSGSDSDGEAAGHNISCRQLMYRVTSLSRSRRQTSW